VVVARGIASRLIGLVGHGGGLEGDGAETEGAPVEGAAPGLHHRAADGGVAGGGGVAVVGGGRGVRVAHLERLARRLRHHQRARPLGAATCGEAAVVRGRIWNVVVAVGGRRQRLPARLGHVGRRRLRLHLLVRI